MKIGVRIRADWLREGDEDIRFLKQIGVDCVGFPLDMLQGYRSTGSFDREDIKRLVERLGAIGLTVEGATAPGPMCQDALLGRPNSPRQIEKLCQAVQALGEVGIPLLSVHCFYAATPIQKAQPAPGSRPASNPPGHPTFDMAIALADQEQPGWTLELGRGGYRYPAFRLDAFQSINFEPTMHISDDRLWANLIAMYKELIPVAEMAGVKVAMHGNDPPLPWACGNPQILCNFADFDRLFTEVPSPTNAMTFCVGTRYESGEDVFTGIEHFGRQNKIAYVHLRNVRGTLPAKGGYEEVFIDEGDLNLKDVLRALKNVGYDGVVDFDHVMGVSGDTPLAQQYVAFAVGYIRGLLTE